MWLKLELYLNVLKTDICWAFKFQTAQIPLKKTFTESMPPLGIPTLTPDCGWAMFCRFSEKIYSLNRN